MQTLYSKMTETFSTFDKLTFAFLDTHVSSIGAAYNPQSLLLQFDAPQR